MLRTLLRRTFSTPPGSTPPPLPVLSNTPKVVSLTPARVEVIEGKQYYWCACGHTKTEPWCDGTHKGTSTIRPVKWVAPKSGMVSLCSCRGTLREGRVLCDGRHAVIASEKDKPIQ